MNSVTPYLNALEKMALPEGGWGYSPGQQAHLEPTCLALLALSLDPDQHAQTRSKAIDLLVRALGADGAFRLAGDRDEATWPTALALFTLNVLGENPGEQEKAAERLLKVYAQQPDTAQAREVHDIDLRLLGWPWAEGNFSWVEPTGWACIALRKAGRGDEARVEQGMRLLLDRAFDEGGINYGNRTVLGKKTDPIPGPTALMLLAVQGIPEHPRVAASLRYLLEHCETSTDVEHLCWARLALQRYPGSIVSEERLTAIDRRIADAWKTRDETTWVREATMRVALSALALAAGPESYFALPAVKDASKIVGQSPVESLKIPAPVVKRSLAERFRARFRGMAIEAAGRLRPAAAQAAVHIAPASDYNVDLVDVLSRQYETFRAQVPLAGKRVVLKPNLVEYHRNKVINTHPNVVAAAIELCRKEGAAEVVVAEGPGHWRNAEYLVEASGLGDVLQHHKVQFVDLNHDQPVKTPNMGRLTKLENLFLSRTIASADVVISMPKLKTHHWAGATLSLKNLFGTMPGICYGWPKNELHWRGIDNSIVDIALTRTPDLAIVDGIIGMEGDGPLNGVAKPFGAIVMGSDLVAVDATCCRLMELDPEKILYLILGYQKKLGLLRESEILQLGESIVSLAKPFETLPHFKELRLARSA